MCEYVPVYLSSTVRANLSVTFSFYHYSTHCPLAVADVYDKLQKTGSSGDAACVGPYHHWSPGITDVDSHAQLHNDSADGN